MNEEFDDRLKNRITDIFDNYEDDSADEGWLLLREKYPEKEKRRAIAWFWWGSAAAVLLVVLCLGIWMNGNNTTQNTIVKNKPAVDKQSTDNGAASDTNKPNITGKANNTAANHTVKTQVDVVPAGSVKRSELAAKPVNAHSNNKTALLATHRYVAKNNTDTHRGKHQKTVRNTNNSDAQIDAKQGIANPQTMANNTAHDNNLNPAKANTDSTVIANNVSDKPVAKQPAEAIKPAAKKTEHPIFAAQNPNKVDAPKQVSEKVKFGVYAATYFNYSKGSDNEFNVGAGLSAEIKLVGNLKLLTGLAINQNSLNYQTTLPQKAGQYLSYSLASQSKMLDLPATAGSPGGLTSTANPVLQNYQASLFGLDIPVNLKYQFVKADTYLSAGVSSGTYINETYSFVYNYASPISKTNDQSTKTQNSFNTFDFARTLNVSFGMGYPLGKNNRLIIEPFLKYPLDGLGSQDLKFGAGGLNLKLNFSTGKK